MTTIEELRREASALVVCGGFTALLRKAASELEALQKKLADYIEAFGLVSTVNGDMPINANSPMTMARELESCFNALQKENAELKEQRDESTRVAKAWEESASRHCRNESFLRDLIVKIGEPFGVAARTSDDGSVQQDVLVLKVPELVSSLRTQNEAMREALKESMADISRLKSGNGDPVDRLFDGYIKRLQQALAAQPKGEG